MGPAGDDAAARHRGEGRFARDAVAHHARAVHRRRDRTAARPPRTARGVACLRLRRRQPDPRHPPRLGEGSSGACQAARGDDTGGSTWSPRLGRRPRPLGLRRVPAVPARERRPAAAVRRVLRAGGRQPLHGAPRRLRAGDDDGGRARGVRRPRSRAQRPGGEGAGRRRLVPARRVRPGRAKGVRGTGRVHPRARAGRLAARPDRAPVLHLVREPRRTTHDPLPRGRSGVCLVDAARGRPRAVRVRDCRQPAAHTARGLAVPRLERVAEPHLGEPGRTQPPLLAALVPARCR